MSKTGTFISVAEDQNGKKPEIVTPDRPFPVTIKSTDVDSKVDEELLSYRMDRDLQEQILLELKMQTAMMREAFNSTLTKREIE